MDEVIEKWFNRDYDFFENNMIASMSADTIPGAYCILNIIESSLLLFIDYCYDHTLKIKDSSSVDKKLLPGFGNFKYSVEIDDNVYIDFVCNVDTNTNQILYISLLCNNLPGSYYQYLLNSGSALTNASTKNVVQMRVKMLLKDVIEHITSNPDLETYFILQGINVRNFNI